MRVDFDKDPARMQNAKSTDDSHKVLEPSGKRIPGLDGLRAIAVCLVIIYHSQLGMGHGSANDVDQVRNEHQSTLIRIFTDNGPFGVELFFVLSGFLITTLLLIEESKHGRFSLSSFYGRRALRILPPALFYLAVLAALTGFGLAHVSLLDFTASALFFRNLVSGSTETAHYWTLSVEEQFYLIWPFLMFAIRRNRFRLALLLFLIAVAPVWRHLNDTFVAGGADAINWQRFDLKFDPLVFGCTLALLRFDKAWSAILRNKLILNPFTAAATVIILLLDLMIAVPAAVRFVLISLQCACIALLISYVSDKSEGWSGKILNWRPVAWVGTLSYSLYVWNMLLLKAYPGHQFWIRNFPQNIIGTFFFAMISYYCVEKPFLQLRRRIFRA